MVFTVVGILAPPIGVVGHKNAKLYAKAKNLHILIRKDVFDFEIKITPK
jgi:hypothetical protein